MSSTYYYIHTISYYLGNNRLDNIKKCIEHLNTYNLSVTQKKTDKILFIIYVLYDDINDTINPLFSKLKDLSTNKVDILVLYRFNTGGTIQTMYYTYKYIINNNITTKYFSVWEDDEIFKNENILDKVQEYLDNKFILVGSLFNGNCKNTSYIDGVKKFIPPFLKRKALVPWCKKYHIYNNDSSNELIHDSLYSWVDGRVYITTIENLNIIEKKIGKFTLAPEHERYSHCEHGINYGEVGFCTRLHLNGFKFFGLPSNEYYKELNEKSIGNKYI